MKGFIFRLGQGIKEAGERRGWKRLIAIGYAVRAVAMRGKY
jgi:hypothetical protein